MNHLHQAIEILKKGGIIIYPTDTAFGIGCRIDREDAIKRLFSIRNRPAAQAVPVLVDSADMAAGLFLSPLPARVRYLMRKYWPGALTIVYYCNREKVSASVCGGGEMVGVRMPNHKTVLSLIKGAAIPILGPSANFHGLPTPYKFKDLDAKLVKLVDYVLPGQCSIKNVSTVIDCSTARWRIIRQGAIKL
ncbi:threonylcarbamoyl-AMP synthase [Candidatus Gottesmanbacteria bacterium]|nr:threonylcarbamoyl-AMP synthase [Candidatus Gottesmanbacteria bacterium]